MTSLREEAALSDFAGAHQRKHNDYTYRLPTPPRIIVPPPTLTTEIPGLTVSHGGDVDLSFLRELDLADIISKNTLLDWAYERRRQAQMILPWLYLGPMVAAKDTAFLVREGITMAFAIRARENSMTGAIQYSRSVCAEIATIDVPTFHDLIGRFAETTRMINTHVARYREHALQTTGQATLGKVLVFCESGNEKSAAIVAAYLMTTLEDFDHVKSMQVCQAQRFCVNYDDTLKNILRSYWDILQAQRSVVPSNGVSGNGNRTHLQVANQSRPKRSIESMRDDDDVDMENGMDVEDAARFEGRDATPFQNREG
ncbi:hypothetical protein FB567DRAFT_528755 [Paraphoma chrysanthemicola]|uniref:Uncharacterized protein n=1 Tax=Paraphoma chrysanthemicola TaxID=798071 RepID=A0A8K0VXY0_9PLEO|nr:hypothetical protein FB567DRAFT_528755 [Paraphoma chrysanthemicola]